MDFVKHPQMLRQLGLDIFSNYHPVYYSYFVGFSRGAGAAPLPEREVSSQNPFFFHFVPPAAAQNEN
jgi:hypothetical protein